MLAVHGLVESFKHADYLGDSLSIRINSCALEYPFEPALHHTTASEGMFIMSTINNKFLTSRAKSRKHGDFKQHLTLAFIPSTSAWRSVNKLFFVFLVPVFIEFSTGLGDAERAAAGLQVLAELDAAEFSGFL